MEGWSVSEAASWVRGLDLHGDFGAVFEAECISGAVLAQLTASDLLELGMEKFGDRKKVLGGVSTHQHRVASQKSGSLFAWSKSRSFSAVPDEVRLSPSAKSPRVRRTLAQVPQWTTQSPLEHHMWGDHHARGLIPYPVETWGVWYQALEATMADGAFWLGIFAKRHKDDGCVNGVFTWGDCAVDMEPARPKTKRRSSLAAAPADKDLEGFLDSLYDLTPGRVSQIFSRFCRGTPGRMSLSELSSALRHQGLVLDTMIKDIVTAVDNDGDQKLLLPEFEVALTRLKLADILVNATDGAQCSDLNVLDYNAEQLTERKIRSRDEYRPLFFGHREDPSHVRWIHMNGLDKSLLLCLAVKYHLKPLGVEDAWCQSPTKVDRFGSHYFVAVDLYSYDAELTEQMGGRVHIRRDHISIFASGPPNFDTMITISSDPDTAAGSPQVDSLALSSATGRPASEQSFSSASRDSREHAGRRSGAPSDHSVDSEFCNPLEPPKDRHLTPKLLEGLRQRLMSSRSNRIREKRSDFLLYEFLDRCVNELHPITVAYRFRLVYFRQVMSQEKHSFSVDSLNEISEISLELMELLRVIRPLRQVLRHFVEDSAFSVDEDVHMYLGVARDKLDQMQDDLGQLRDVCKSLTDDNNRHSDKKMNDTLFILTCASAIFMPAQFLSGVYGMNIKLPEESFDGMYPIFWCLTLLWFSVSTFVAVRSYRVASSHRQQQPTRVRRYTSVTDDEGGERMNSMQMVRDSSLGAPDDAMLRVPIPVIPMSSPVIERLSPNFSNSNLPRVPLSPRGHSLP
eukprot:TRINITY_DN9213_c0_g1_i2.p1 TRINITY_DN9213_c0_g1~~TRINITY_DN9213_c0_g1_i2.p1  ORF type:complete len:794 (+),score=130.25 TRINITY_DN9213_c0_g1_i2:41-2422(+)